jgi:hypothetical protein
MRGIAIASFLIDSAPPIAPAGFAVLRTAVDGLPRELALSDGWSAIVFAPTGMASAWLDADPAALVSSSDAEFVPTPPNGTPVQAAPVRLVIRRSGVVVGALPLAVGVRGTFRAPSALLELEPLSWAIRAGAMRGGVPDGARIELAWRSRVVPPGVVTGAR